MTVAVIDPDTGSADPRLAMRRDGDFRIEWFSGTGKGGQHRNKHQNSCRFIHVPTGMKQERTGRSRDDNLREARAALLRALDEAASGQVASQVAAERRGQVGSGQRGDKVRTYRFQDDRVTDHRTERRATVAQIMAGEFARLW